jgi:hypothetical protein
MFFCHDLGKETIERYCGSLSGTLNSGLSNMLSPCPIFTPFSQQTQRINLVTQRIENLEKNICDLIFKLVLDFFENIMFMQHLLIDLRQVVKRQ